MTKKHYQILGVSEKAVPEEIKKSYHQLSLKWHPDRWSGKDIKERKQANEMMQEINKAYEILSDAEKRKRYDLGLTDFPADNFDYDPKEEVRRQKEELRKREIHVADLELEILKLEMKALDRSSTLNEIGAAFCFTLPRVHAEDLDSILWQPYQSWGAKVVKMEITIPRGKDRSEELKRFKEEMIKAIKEAEIILRVNEENKKENENDSELNQARMVAFQEIEKSMNGKDLKVEDLGQYSNYQERINSLGEVWEIRNFREEILVYISKSGRKEPERRGENDYRWPNDIQRENHYNPYPPIEQPNYRFPNSPIFSNYNLGLRENPPNYPSRPNPNPRFSDRTGFPKLGSERVPNNRWDETRDRIEENQIDNFLSGLSDNKYNNWTHQDLVEEIKQGQLNNAALHKLISALETRNKELEEDIQTLTLKVTTPQTSRIKQMFFGKEKQYETQVEIPPKK